MSDHRTKLTIAWGLTIAVLLLPFPLPESPRPAPAATASVAVRRDRKPPAPKPVLTTEQEARVRQIVSDELAKARAAETRVLFGGKVPNVGRLPAVRGGGK